MLTWASKAIGVAVTAAVMAAACVGQAPSRGAPPLRRSAAAAAATAADDPDDPSGVIGSGGLSWDVSQWFNSPPLALSDLRGKVVFVRWFMSPKCPLCTRSAPALRELDRRYRDRGLIVVGMYHHQETTPLDPAQVRGWIDQYGFRFPVGIDKDWTTLKRWWLDGHDDRSYTSVSFLFDRDGVVRYVHKGGLIDPEGEEMKSIEALIETLLPGNDMAARPAERRAGE